MFLDALKDEHAVLIENVWTSSKAYIIANAPFTHVLVISGSIDSKLLDDLPFFTDRAVYDFPSWETLPGEEITPSPDVMGKRLDTLEKLNTDAPKIVVTSLQGALQSVPAHVASITWKTGQELPFDDLPKRLSDEGYVRVPIITDKGQFALRGGILDVFPLNALTPYRIEFFGDTIDEIRTFDIASQKSIESVQSITLTAANEVNSTALLLDYLPKDTLIVFDDLASLEDHLVTLRSISDISIAPLFNQQPHLYLIPETIEKLSPGKHARDFATFEIFSLELAAKRVYHNMLAVTDAFHGQLIDGLMQMPAKSKIRFITANKSEEKALKSQLPKLAAKTVFETGYLSSGIVFPNEIIFPFTELSHRPKMRRTQWRSSYHTPASEFHELEPGDLVVHFHNGVGKYLGIEAQADSTGETAEFMLIEYSGNSKLFVPLSQAHLISRYIGTKETHPQLDTLGAKKWHTAKVRAQRAIIGYARELLEVHAKRELHGGTAYPPDSEDMELFEASFPYIPTDDQVQAVKAIKEDMTSKKAMDRLICGDVGYGKTEVAMRAAFKAAADGGKQVAVLVPTTVLAMQHFETFRDRMADFPVRVAVLSRFVSAKETKKTLAEIQSGAVDIVIGTHRLISKDLVFKNLGLIIIDEEQRFGVRAKEHLKKLKAGVDCLTLSATPIPRTLYLSLTGARDLSIINTPPQDRLPIKTIISDRDDAVIKTALLRELSRDGQAYFIHNRVESIYKIANELQALVPFARIAVAHGQMKPDEIDQTFHAFKQGTADILVATTLVENGVDIPSANTILIDRSHQFGLSDLYQLRGRVGRWNRSAYAYFLVPKKTLEPDAQKRLQALVDTSGFGGGMKLAMRDLEIRGSGDILGTQQSGHLSQIGFHLYCKLLKKAMHALTTNQPASFIQTKIESPYPARLPSGYIPETSLRLEIYHRLGDLTTADDIDGIGEELRDRFGPPPPEVGWLLALTRIRLHAEQRLYTLVKITKNSVLLESKKGKQTFPLNSINSPATLEKAILTTFHQS